MAIVGLGRLKESWNERSLTFRQDDEFPLFARATWQKSLIAGFTSRYGSRTLIE